MSFNWWQTMAFVILIFAGGFFTRQWTTVPPPPQLLPGTHTVDTVKVEIPPVAGSTTATVKKKTSERVKSDSSQQKPELPPGIVSEASLYETNVDTIQNGVHIAIRATAYVLSKDSILQTIEYNVQPRPTMTIVTTDTIYVMKEVPVPKEPAFFEKPAVAYVVGGIIGGAIVIAIRKLTE